MSDAPSVARLIEGARKAAKLTHHQLAQWSRLDADRLRGVERGEATLSALEVDRVARVFGLRLDDFVGGKAGRAPMTLLLREAPSSELDYRDVLTTEIQEGLGEFQRVVRDIADLESLIERRGATLPRIVVPRRPPGTHPGDFRARCVRERLGLRLAPIPSMRKLVEALDVAVVSVTNDQVDRALDGACVLTPRPAILVNLQEVGDPFPWRARVTIAHELGHLLFDMSTPSTQVMVSPNGELPARLARIERDARAFAACLLAPTEGVLEVVGSSDPTSDDAIRRVGATFGVGRTLSINRLQRVFRLSDPQRTAMEDRTPIAYAGDFADDTAPEPVGFRGQPLRDLVRVALQTGRLSIPRARRHLALRSTDRLPFDDLDLATVAQPPVDAAMAAVRSANAYLARKGLLAARPSLLADGRWSVDVIEGGVGVRQPTSRGSVIVDASGAVVQDDTEPRAAVLDR